MPGLVRYLVSVRGSPRYSVALSLRDADGVEVAKGEGASGELKVLNPALWWPYLMHESPGYLYYLEVM